MKSKRAGVNVRGRRAGSRWLGPCLWALLVLPSAGGVTPSEVAAATRHVGVSSRLAAAIKITVNSTVERSPVMKRRWQTWVDVLPARNKSSNHPQSMQRPLRSAAGEPYRGEEWAVWYVDTFDRDAPPRVDVRGRGLVEGLAQLWARHLFETVRPDGQQGFSSFDLRWKQGRVEISGDREGAKRLRGWMFGKKESSYKGYAAEADPALLKKVALAHARLIEWRQRAEQILAIASVAKDKTDFASRLDDLIKK